MTKKFIFQGKEYNNFDEYIKAVRKLCVGCPFFYSEINECMVGESNITYGLEQMKCKREDFD